MLNKFRRIFYTDDGCSLYQCLSCYNKFECRDDPEYGWKFCPFCGIKWDGKLKCRSHYQPRWKYDLVDHSYEENEIDYEELRKIEDHINETDKRNRGLNKIWSIEIKRSNGKWSVQRKFEQTPASIGVSNTIHQAIKDEVEREKSEYFNHLKNVKKYLDKEQFEIMYGKDDLSFDHRISISSRNPNDYGYVQSL